MSFDKKSLDNAISEINEHTRIERQQEFYTRNQQINHRMIVLLTVILAVQPMILNLLYLKLGKRR